MKYEGLIFDCDGVLVDSEHFSCGAWNVLFQKKYGIDIGTNYEPILGKQILDSAQYFLEKYNMLSDKKNIQELANLKEETYVEIATGNIKPIPGVKRIIQEAKKLGYKIAVASSGSQEKIKFSLTQAGIYKNFNTIISADEVEKGKPAPDLFLKAMKVINVRPEKCIIIEDSLTGIIAAKSSGAFTIGISTTFPLNRLKNADLVIKNFNELDLKKLSEL